MYHDSVCNCNAHSTAATPALYHDSIIRYPPAGLRAALLLAPPLVSVLELSKCTAATVEQPAHA
ncbi:hypothetical protein HBI56_057130 [Parastagonospora nodorum]|uniref:Uncharacterized protein n=1 Tax=Phaeosphaeria nodorum (strain SN15 / ATCC MYA-4574 / FGSC 10173) TaxID=321614 RepID=A0A7U2IC88_PHANO|nr:hypothetical protein HBH56_094980 [Parastagonospora nodorum]QRD07133.1 hypothetical protein JI435_423990 [Parastagonospora nodorum SN15]KAH3930182.1 hypothetical protein HBH54_109300 [Parastagonospora nodorum]KAH3945057.1 hypothetical protein HBH53_150110 [Parastagonospora nodorum]KAH3966902.1 hypothetical protein HBH51_141520 [Parastagonospora nodorum]